jgi:adenylate cyclase class 2
MGIEFEATFTNIDKQDVRDRLKSVGAKLVRKEGLMRRTVFHLPGKKDIDSHWLRVRDEGDKITMSLKIIDGIKIENQREICLNIDDFDTGVKFLESIGAGRKSYQETLRELWELDGVEITIDTWPFLEPFVEVEGPDEPSVKVASTKLGFDYDSALFCATDELYSRKYNISKYRISNETPKIVFDMENPFI